MTTVWIVQEGDFCTSFTFAARCYYRNGTIDIEREYYDRQPNLLFLHNIIVRVRELYVFLSNPLIII